ncbi:TonB-dependent receptor plug domain-containing protein [Prevotella sp. Rep29]|uniref:TonB-dependent receptor plug domain-containing protein n=1 Tax=Prevotella sp. Rep29 TaxID=2691580 RepID=UPI001B5169C5|nr:TonB-dependent receptor plug domain-containing protein [Prevotella sp. Rep29]MBP3834608.1 TonB-dependent receptor plug domain-containing protein [Prevotella sp.]QYR10083.1 TonB-dependent receptor plug domain-containing protein [Prevotella sp. Rep29]
MEIKKSTFLILLSLVMAACGTTREKQLKTVDMGYGETSQEALSYAISSVDMEEADKSGYITIYDYLEGRMPGVKVVKNGATTASVYIRGINSVNSSTEPLFVVDGIMVNDISYLNPRDVKSVTVLKDASASIYGVRGGNGAILIKLK